MTKSNMQYDLKIRKAADKNRTKLDFQRDRWKHTHKSKAHEMQTSTTWGSQLL